MLSLEQVAAVAREAATDPSMRGAVRHCRVHRAAVCRRAARSALGADRFREPDPARRAQLDLAGAGWTNTEGPPAPQRAAFRPGSSWRSTRPQPARSPSTAPSDLVFGNELGEYAYKDAIRRRLLRSARWRRARATYARTGQQPIISYDLRHTFGSLGVREGASTSSDDAGVDGACRHVSTTMRYVHYVPQHDAAARLTAAFTPDSVPGTVPRTGVPQGVTERN